MSRKKVYLTLCVLGVLLPYSHFLPWLLEHGLDLPLFFRALHANRVSEFFAADVTVSAAAVLALLAFERRGIGAYWWLPVIGLFIAGVSLALPLLLYLREAHRPETA
jgi:hypothetical protein